MSFDGKPSICNRNRSSFFEAVLCSCCSVLQCLMNEHLKISGRPRTNSHLTSTLQEAVTKLMLSRAHRCRERRCNLVVSLGVVEVGEVARHLQSSLLLGCFFCRRTSSQRGRGLKTQVGFRFQTWKSLYTYESLCMWCVHMRDQPCMLMYIHINIHIYLSLHLSIYLSISLSPRVCVQTYMYLHIATSLAH